MTRDKEYIGFKATVYWFIYLLAFLSRSMAGAILLLVFFILVIYEIYREVSLK